MATTTCMLFSPTHTLSLSPVHGSAMLLCNIGNHAWPCSPLVMMFTPIVISAFLSVTFITAALDSRRRTDGHRKKGAGHKPHKVKRADTKRSRSRGGKRKASHAKCD
ncbi:hypothetical protein KP509_17G000200 [Ceratopteris richardii]|uniref:Uncharacterized protein n=1 Tax=Ceratopteris richardii TaxID=49495 RepID=A0A8T2ST32_CERRI|nr:hypothetical protein KP509_17G000200 [Ceratopteris richardii]